jgi:Response regulator containing CheY-like receiver, AAA-type ATPase, and DNA-binding domains
MKLLIVDDEENVRKGLATFLGLSGHESVSVPSVAAAKEALAGGIASGSAAGGASSGPFGAALVDIYIGAENGAAVLDFVAERGLGLAVVMMSGKGSVKDAVDAVKRGAYDFLEKPLDTDRLLSILRNIERESAATDRIEAFRSEWLAEHVYLEKGSDYAAAFEQARRAAASPLSVLVSGPSGSGKELAARWIHLCSPRSRGPFVAVNCAAIPAELAESEFFGSKKGAFTGALADRAGYFEAASGGTLFLDEVGELPLALQAKLLRAVELGEIQRLGSSEAMRVDLRIVAATNRDLGAEIAAGRFREDLYWRLAQTTIVLPSLDARRSEIRGLALFLAAPIRAQMGAQAPALGEAALGYLESRSWPGNVRELRAFIERSLWLAPQCGALRLDYLASLETARPAAASQPSGLAPISRNATIPANEDGLDTIKSLAEAKDDFEREYVSAALERSGGSVAKAAQALGLLPNNLSRKIKELGIRH